MGNFDLSTPFLALVQDWKALIDSHWTRWQKNESPQTQNIVIFAKFCTFVINATKSYNLSANNKSKKYYCHFQDKTESTSRTRVVALWKVQVSVIRMPWNVVSYNLESLLTYVLLVFQLLPLLLECWCNRIVGFFSKNNQYNGSTAIKRRLKSPFSKGFSLQSLAFHQLLLYHGLQRNR